MQSEKRKKLFLIEKGYYDLIDKYFKDIEIENDKVAI